MKPTGSYISFFSNLVKEKGGVNLAQGIPGFQPPEKLLKSLSNTIYDNVHQYAPSVGDYKLLDLLGKHYSQRFEVDVNNFLVVQGATEALSLIYTYLFQKLNGNFSVLSFEPAYESYSQLPAIFGQEFVNFSLNKYFSFDLDSLKEKIVAENVKIVFLSSPGNPFGKIWSKVELETLVNLSHDLEFYIIFDAVYKELYFESPPHIPLGYNSPNVFYVSSFSKMFCITGWRIGYLYAHESHREAIRSIHDYIGLCAPSLLQRAIADYFEDNSFGEDFLDSFRRNVNQGFDILSEALKQNGFYIPPIKGGCFIWAKLPEGITDGFQFAYSLYQNTGVAIIPGEHFSPNCISWVRFNIARPMEEIEKAANLIVNFTLKL
jgi:aspartate/methionine/tyrosine aminotransferase